MARTSSGVCLVYAVKVAASGDATSHRHCLEEAVTAFFAARDMNERECALFATAMGLPPPKVHWKTLPGADNVQKLLKNIVY